MMVTRKMCALILMLSMLLCGCTLPDPPNETTAPSRMVVEIAVSIHPRDPDFDRVYTSREHLDELLLMLRTMQTKDIPEESPNLNGGQSYYTVTITYANGRTGQYHLLGHSYLQMDGDWCRISTEDAMAFSQFIRDHPSEQAA